MSIGWNLISEVALLKLLGIKPVRIDADGEREIEFEDLTAEELEEFYGMTEEGKKDGAGASEV